jgi:hypothetical protein
MNMKNMAEASSIVHTLLYTRDSTLEIPYTCKSVSKPFLSVQVFDSINIHIGEILANVHNITSLNQSSNLPQLPENSYWRGVLQMLLPVPLTIAQPSFKIR